MRRTKRNSSQMRIPCNREFYLLGGRETLRTVLYKIALPYMFRNSNTISFFAILHIFKFTSSTSDIEAGNQNDQEIMARRAIVHYVFICLVFVNSIVAADISYTYCEPVCCSLSVNFVFIPRKHRLHHTRYFLRCGRRFLSVIRWKLSNLYTRLLLQFS